MIYIKIQFYYVDDKYIDFLKNKEQEKRDFTCVPNVIYSNRNKFLYGSVMQVNDINYFVPISSRVGKNPQYNLDIKTNDKKNNIKGALRFPYMIPVPTKCLIKLDINKISDQNEKARISKELAFCRKNKDKIEKYAQNTYNDILQKKNDKLINNSCDFKILEQAYIEYCKENKLECPQISNKDNNFEKLNEIYANVFEDIKTDNVSLPTSLENTEDRVAVSQYIIEQLNSGETTEVQRKSLEKLRDSIREAEEPLFKQRADEMSNWADYVIEKAEERNKGNDEQNRNDIEK